MKIFRSILYCAVLFYSVTACVKKEQFSKFEYQELDPTWGVPLIDSKLQLKDVVAILDTSLGIRQEQDSSYTFYYYDTISSPKMEDIFQLADQSFTKVIQSPLSASLPFPAGDTVSESFAESAAFDAGNGSSLKYINLKDGNLALDISSTFKNDVSIHITLPSLLDQNQKPLTRVYQISPDKSFISDVIPLAGYQVLLTGNGNETNAFTYSATYTVTSLGQPLNTGDGLFVSLGLKSLQYKLIVGDIGNINFPPYTGDLDLKVFEQASYGDLYFSQAKLDLTFANSIGIPVTFTINELRSTTSYGATVDITPVNPKFVIPLGAPSLQEQGAFVYSSTQLNNTNSKIVDAVNPAPNNIDYDFSTTLASTENSFILDTSRIKVYARISIPLKGYVTDFQLKDTLVIKSLPERTFSQSDISESLDSAVFKIKMENSIPANASTQLYFLDEKYQMVDSLLLKPDYIIASNNVDPATGNVLTPTTTETVVSMNGQRYDIIKEKAEYFYIFSHITTPVNQSTGKPINIELLSENSLRVVISVLVKGQIKIQ